MSGVLESIHKEQLKWWEVVLMIPLVILIMIFICILFILSTPLLILEEILANRKS